MQPKPISVSTATPIRAASFDASFDAVRNFFNFAVEQDVDGMLRRDTLDGLIDAYVTLPGNEKLAKVKPAFADAVYNYYVRMDELRDQSKIDGKDSYWVEKLGDSLGLFNERYNVPMLIRMPMMFLSLVVVMVGDFSRRQIAAASTPFNDGKMTGDTKSNSNETRIDNALSRLSRLLQSQYIDTSNGMMDISKLDKTPGDGVVDSSSMAYHDTARANAAVLSLFAIAQSLDALGQSPDSL